MAITHQIAYAKKLAKARASGGGDLQTMDLVDVVALKKQRAAVAASGGSIKPPMPPPPETVAAGDDPRKGLEPAFLLQVDAETMAWLEARRVALGLRSRAQVIRGVLTAARKGT